MDYVGPFTFNAVRSLLGGVVLIPCIFLLNRINKRKTGTAAKNRAMPKKPPKDLIIGGLACGFLMFVIYQPAAGWNHVHHRCKSWVYNCIIYYYGARPWYFLETKSRIKDLDQCFYLQWWDLYLSMHERQVFLSAREIS